MKPLTVSVLSDLHLDSHFPVSIASPSEEAVRKVFDPIFKTPADVLVVAGDLGHYNHQNRQIIKWLRRLYFKHIVCVLGNHDYYLSSRIMMDDFEEDSFKRVSQLRQQLNEIEGVYCLNGDIVEIEGVRFGGCDSWYDGSYWLKHLNPHYIYAMHHVKELWKFNMPDAMTIKGIKSFDDIWRIEQPKIEAVYKECDVMITHVLPLSDTRYIEHRYRTSRDTSFFCFDGNKYVRETSAKVWIYGHTHSPNDFTQYGVRIVSNQLGYRGEMGRSPAKEKIIEIHPKNQKEE